MRIAIVGTINSDRIFPYGGEPVESLGGIYYTTMAMAHLSKGEGSILPICYVGEDARVKLLDGLGGQQHISTAGLIFTPQPNHRSILKYFSRTERRERSELPFPELPWEALEPALNADRILVNMITGWDLSTDSFLRLCQARGEVVHLDIHYLLMGRDRQGNRYPRKPADADLWLRGPAFVQMNETEYATLGGFPGEEKAFFAEKMRPEQHLIITQGKKGALMLTGMDGRVAEFVEYGIESDEATDPTGCGDVFGAAFVTAFHRTGSATGALAFANLAGAANACLSGTGEMGRLFAQMERLKPLA